MKKSLALVAALALGLLTSAASAADQVRIFAAASVAPSIQKIADTYKVGKDVEVLVTPAASGALAKQIEAGAPADIFISADLKWMTYANEKGLMKEGSSFNLLGNSLVLVAAKDDKVAVDLADTAALQSVLGDERLAVGEAKSVPAGAYAEEALKSLGLYDAVSPRFAPAENVRVALQMVARGEAKLGIVYGTDAAAEPGVAVAATFPETSHKAIVYPIGLTKGAGPSAADFVAYLKGPEADAVFAAAGFIKPAK
ncbi:molybdate ABC transporter substrate-binding protein [Pleomorphomonas sp. NRK KF1]|uniref:molybdate ABC transporter substrate-binding protein n=1 Tax=Pleomorphomonas sp. NRK KF1 TaxID=2943000 RepID=UPI0020440CD2|nr:molybdate ABC transporter substrate-binding protein [Pleomorphomonas sp. NRK KF1]MCM5553670.1 molybdate ABC transporter substrate-binding protein [Pleomorphomonas sp. NRK KF1]